MKSYFILNRFDLAATSKSGNKGNHIDKGLLITFCLVFNFNSEAAESAFLKEEQL